MPKPLTREEQIAAEETKQLAAELLQLSREHSIAVRDATFTGMTDAQKRTFDQRRERISEICGMIKAKKR
jgi:hypothetical protein